MRSKFYTHAGLYNRQGNKLQLVTCISMDKSQKHKFEGKGKSMKSIMLLHSLKLSSLREQYCITFKEINIYTKIKIHA